MPAIAYRLLPSKRTRYKVLREVRVSKDGSPLRRSVLVCDICAIGARESDELSMGDRGNNFCRGARCGKEKNYAKSECIGLAITFFRLTWSRM